MTFTAPRFHHLHLRSMDPHAAIAFYTSLFPCTAAGEWAGIPALFSSNDVMVLFEQADSPPPSLPQSAIWHFGWHVTDSRATVEAFGARAEVEMLPLYTGVGDGSVHLSSDTWFKTGDTLGVTLNDIASLRSNATKPPGGAGFAYFRGPDSALVEIAGDYPSERFNHIHMWQEQPLCAQLWYQKHFGVQSRASFGDVCVDEQTCAVPRAVDKTFPALNRDGMYRAPRGGVTVGDVDLIWYPNQGAAPLVPSDGQLQDHFAFAVEDLDEWIGKLKREGVRFLSAIYGLGPTRAVVVEGPSRECIELVESQ